MRKLGKPLKQPVFPLMAWFLCFAGMTFYNGYYKINLDDHELPVNKRWAEAIALKWENGGRHAFTKGPFVRDAIRDQGVNFRVILRHEVDGCTRKVIDVAQATEKL
ncbi:hypothetical protein GCM10011571_20260 [Marinithermofilum abyssi]|uniref:Uncharacterized protein n=1 Tax=Marinithermofilum abyssi TaxID=1571185 RepID=A0A8J2YDM4_9BACL|nr:hypothetical protein [Marinithermofilum abyssi]GGE18361.1 hypothetical protein GCM10011571_20260 [Marinithermofilum abyssi]